MRSTSMLACVAAAAIAGALCSSPARAERGAAVPARAKPSSEGPAHQPERVAQRRTDEEGSKLPHGPSSQPGGLPGARPAGPQMRGAKPKPKAAAPKPDENKKDTEPASPK
jgi:hypothetical protein